MRLKMAREAEVEIHSEGDLRHALQRLGDANEFAILSRSQDEFIQAGVDGDGFVVNRSTGAERTLLWAAPKSTPAEPTKYHRFSLEGVEDLFGAYYRGEPLAQWHWQIEYLPEPTVFSRLGVFLLRYAFWPVLILLLLASYYLKYFR